MTEYEAIEALSSVAANVATYYTVFFSLTFGYLSVAYFVGAELTRFQCLVVSATYLLSTSIFGASALTWTNTWVALKTGESSAMDNVWLANALSAFGDEWNMVIVVSVVLMSLYFMYDIRRKAEI